MKQLTAMKTLIRSAMTIGCLAASVFLFSCGTAEDPGPIQNETKTFAVVDFDRLEMGSGFIIDVEHDNFFSISAEGDSRNIDDLSVYKDGNTLVIRYSHSSNRKHETHISITMPELKSANFSGGSVSTVSGFSSSDGFDFYLSGGSIAQVDITSSEVDLTLSGGSDLTLLGAGTKLNADVSGASMLRAFGFQTSEATINASGASSIKVTATDKLTAAASGASLIIYRGSPQVSQSTSGASSIEKD
jgi:hypothetical protein